MEFLQNFPLKELTFLDTTYKAKMLINVVFIVTYLTLLHQLYVLHDKNKKFLIVIVAVLSLLLIGLFLEELTGRQNPLIFSSIGIMSLIISFYQKPTFCKVVIVSCIYLLASYIGTSVFLATCIIDAIKILVKKDEGPETGHF